VTLTLVLLGVVVALCLSLLQRLRLSLAWGPDGRSIRLRYLVFHWTSDKRGSPDAEAVQVRAKKKKKEGGKRWRLSWRRLIALLPEAASAVRKSGGFLVGRCRVEHLRIEGPIGTSDPALTGMVWAAVSVLQHAIVTAGVGQSQLWPRFTDERSRITVDATLSVAAGSLLATPLIFVWHAPKRAIWRAVRSGRSAGKRGGPPKTREQ